jgi:hypothetical protein|tara:strand:- start:2464 stop:2667 length:204 start_codon:yes stop_codon:yes gene_type:complete
MGKIINKAVKVSTFGKIDLDPRAPKLPPVKTAPDPEMEAKAASRALQRKKRTGRTSTIMTQGEGTLG